MEKIVHTYKFGIKVTKKKLEDFEHDWYQVRLPVFVERKLRDIYFECGSTEEEACRLAEQLVKFTLIEIRDHFV